MGRCQVICLILCIASASHAQNQFSFSRLDASKGLSENHVICILQDREGFMWFGTMGGLNRFDGNSFKVYGSDHSLPVGFYNHRIQELYEDKYRNLWIGSFGNIYQRFNKDRNRVIRYPQDLGYENPTLANRIYVHPDGYTVMGFGDLGIFIEKGGSDESRVESYLFDEHILNYDMLIRNLYVHDEKQVLLCTGSGPVALQINDSSSSGTFIHLSAGLGILSNTLDYVVMDSCIYFITSGAGLIRYNPNTGISEQVIEFENESITSFTACTKSSGGKAWFATSSQGMLGLDKEGSVIRITSYRGETFDMIGNIFSDRLGNIWFSAVNYNGIFRYNHYDLALEFIPIDLKTSKFRQSGSNRNFIAYVFQDSKDIVWIGTTSDGILRYDPRSNRVSHIKNDPDKQNSISANGQLYAFEDRSKTLWFGTNFGGVNKLNSADYSFHNIKQASASEDRFDNQTNSILRDSYGNLWTNASDGKLYVYDKENGQSHVFSAANPLGKRSRYVESHYFCMIQDSRGRLWLGSKGEGILLADLHAVKGDPERIRFKQYVHEGENPKSLSGNNIYDLFEDLEGRVWIAGHGSGLNMVEQEPDSGFINMNPGLFPVLPKELVFGRFVNGYKDGRIWYGGMDGVCSFKVDSNSHVPRDIKYFEYRPGNENSLVYNDITCVFKDYTGDTWIGTWGGGVSVYHPEKDSMSSFTITSGLPNDIIYGICQTPDSMIWLTTENGLSRYDPERNSFRNYFTENGLPINSFSEARPFLDSDGTLYLGTMNGFTYFNSKPRESDEFDPEILLTRLFIDNQEVESYSGEILSKSIHQTRLLELSFPLNSFRIDVISSDYSMPERTRFSYMLEGQDKAWNNLHESNSISYQQLPRGRYKLKIRTTKRDGTWSANQKEINLIVRPPWWATRLAYGIYFFLVLAFVYISYTTFRRFYKLRQSLQVEKKMTRFKLRFFTNLSHEFRTPLTLIINPLEELKQAKLPGELSALTGLAHKNARYLLGLINQILDFRTLQEKKSRLKVTENKVSDFFYSIAENFQYVAGKGNVEYSFETNADNQYAWFDTEKLEKVITNLLSNAFKYTDEGGSVLFELNLNSQKLEITVRDTGKGISVTKLPSIFKRYGEQSDQGNFFTKGTGIGLSLVQEFVNLHRGTVRVESEAGVGSTFRVNLPVSMEDYHHDEFVPRRNWIIGSASEHISEVHQEASGNEKEVSEEEYTIMIVDDDQELRAYLARKFRDCFRVLDAQNGKEGLELARSEYPDFIITDNVMPEMNGIEMTAHLKADPDTTHIPVILLSVKSAKEERMRGLESGANDYIEKPFDLEVLFAKVNNIIRQRELLKKKYSNELNFELPEVSNNDKDKELLKTIETRVLDKIDQPDFHVQDLYSDLGYSKTFFFNKIKASTGMGPKELIRVIKMKEAARLLALNEHSISEVCYMVGYSETNYFRNLFKNQFNMTPSEFVKKSRARRDSLVKAND